MTNSKQAPRRRRRSPEVAQAEILDAAEHVLRKKPFRELTVDEVMGHTGMARSSFWVYFGDRHDLLARVLARLDLALGEMTDRWLKGTGDPATNVRAALEGIVAVFAAHGSVLRAISDASAENPELDRVYHDLVERFITATAGHIRREQAQGTIRRCDPRETARALIWMNERYLSESFGAGQSVPAKRAIEALHGIWVASLYGP